MVTQGSGDSDGFRRPFSRGPGGGRVAGRLASGSVRGPARRGGAEGPGSLAARVGTGNSRARRVKFARRFWLRRAAKNSCRGCERPLAPSSS